MVRLALLDGRKLHVIAVQGLQERIVILDTAILPSLEREADVFFEDRSGHIFEDDTLARLISMPNVIVTSHQAFLTKEALTNIANTTLTNISDYLDTGRCDNEVRGK